MKEEIIKILEIFSAKECIKINDENDTRDKHIKRLNQAFSAIHTEYMKCIPSKRKEGKHDGHSNDDRSWCYDCQCSDDEEEFTNNWLYNQAIDNITKAMEEK